MKNRFALKLYIFLSLSVMAFIFVQSAMPADLSNVESRSIVAVLIRYLGIDRSTLTFLVRKSAHFLEYLLLGLTLSLVSRSFRDRRLQRGRKQGTESREPGRDPRTQRSVPSQNPGTTKIPQPGHRPQRISVRRYRKRSRSRTASSLRLILIPWLIGSFFAVTDEYHQTFVEGRSCELRDMLIDSCGVALGVFLVFLTNRRQRRRQKKASAAEQPTVRSNG